MGSEMDIERRLEAAVRYVAAQWGHGWNRLSPHQREAMIRAEILGEISRLSIDGDPARYRALVDALSMAAMQWDGSAF